VTSHDAAIARKRAEERARLMEFIKSTNNPTQGEQT
jgi:hypothetical protein